MSDPKIGAQIAELMKLPYEKMVRGDEEGGYLATVKEFPGCMTAGETEEEALANLREAMAGWLGSQLAHGQPIPEPLAVAGAPTETHSGRLLLRLPKSMHRQLAERAEEDGVSINQLAVALLAPGLETPLAERRRIFSEFGLLGMEARKAAARKDVDRFTAMRARMGDLAKSLSQWSPDQGERAQATLQSLDELAQKITV
jgi:antitoxin HicB